MNIIAPNADKISGTVIATARGTWVYNDDGTGQYEFFGKDNFQWKITPERARALEISEDDLADCVDQAEEMLGEPDNFKQRLGLMNNGGFKNTGNIFRSRTNPSVCCIFTPTSLGCTPDGLCYERDAYFEWYYKDDLMPYLDDENLPELMSQLDKKIGTVFSIQALNSPMLPSYEEAERIISKTNLTESEKNYFLTRLWNVNRSAYMGRGTRSFLKEELLREWESILKKSNRLDESKKKRKQALNKKS